MRYFQARNTYAFVKQQERSDWCVTISEVDKAKLSIFHKELSEKMAAELIFFFKFKFAWLASFSNTEFTRVYIISNEASQVNFHLNKRILIQQPFSHWIMATNFDYYKN